MRREENWNHLNIKTRAENFHSYEVQKMRICRNICKTLTDEQHTALMVLGKYRHELHAVRADFLSITDVKKETLRSFFQSQLPVLLRSTGLPECNITTFPIWNLSNQAAVTKYIDKVNDSIEEYLLNIDRQHGTMYCPTGMRRERRSQQEHIESNIIALEN